MKQHHPKLFNIWQKHGEPMFVVMWYCKESELNVVEQHFITQYANNSMLANTCLTAHYARDVDRRSKNPWQLGKTFSKEHKRNLSLAKRGKVNGVNNSNAKLTEAQVAEIRARYSKQKKGCGSTTLARDYGVSYRTILMVVNKQRYADVI